MANLSEHISDEKRAELQQLANAKKAEAAKADAKKNRPRELGKLIEQQRRKGFRGDDNYVRWTQPDAYQLLMRGLVYVLGETAQWLPEYDEVAEWLADNQGKGLMLIGDCGRGKTIITQQIMPLLFQHYLRRSDGSHMAYNFTTARELCNCFEEFSQYKIICVDDIGTETKVKKYGNTRDYVEDLVDLAEKQHKLLVLSTNLTFEQLQQRYDIRTLDRLRGLTRRVFFEGESLRA